MKVNNSVTARAYDKLVGSTPRKVLLVAKTILKRKALDAANFLMFCNKKAATYLAKILNSAIANAGHHLGIPADKLLIEEINIGKSVVMKRPEYRAKGRVCTIKKRFSSVEIILSEIITAQTDAQTPTTELINS